MCKCNSKPEKLLFQFLTPPFSALLSSDIIALITLILSIPSIIATIFTAITSYMNLQQRRAAYQAPILPLHNTSAGDPIPSAATF
ncbi:hypothetical protein HYFRA_00000737 [Hymenoscyphus fraxineus]|uniref:Uncharacterized protein n=1 Tax=Hymenoscyphus fraxineus TaxID=746836 RepID=A0A9N9KR85_9HELO|nr:hypothetical protein HYFRA_00000737 [Hymenoscyphus fraxineus]